MYLEVILLLICDEGRGRNVFMVGNQLRLVFGLAFFIED